MPKAVEQHRELHRRKMDGLELFPQRISGGVHQQRMERTADVPVSYTHLDVYKRQALMSRLKKREFN